MRFGEICSAGSEEVSKDEIRDSRSALEHRSAADEPEPPQVCALIRPHREPASQPNFFLFSFFDAADFSAAVKESSARLEGGVRASGGGREEG